MLKLKTQTRTITLPESKKKVKIRPYTVGEELGLLKAKESSDSAAIIDAISSLVVSVSSGDVDPEQDSIVDVMLTYFISRAISVGEQSKLVFKCDCSDEATVESTVDVVNDLKHSIPKVDRTIEIETTEGVAKFKMRSVPFKSFVETDGTIETSAKLLRSCIVSVHDQDGSKIDISQMTDEDWVEFYYGIPSPAMRKIMACFKEAPSVWIEASGKCQKCMKNVTKKIEGIANFM